MGSQAAVLFVDAPVPWMQEKTVQVPNIVLKETWQMPRVPNVTLQDRMVHQAVVQSVDVPVPRLVEETVHGPAVPKVAV